jgi:multimeric flavodoxin WrbA
MARLTFNGSARKNGNTSILLNAVLGELQSEGIETELIQMAGKPVQGCMACYRCFNNKDMKCAVDNDAMNEYIEKMRSADGILLGSPTYFSDVSAAMKALIERSGLVSRANGEMFRRKVGAGVVAVRRAGAIHTFNSLNAFFLIAQMIVPGSSYWNVGIGLEPGDTEKDSEGLETMRTLGQNTAWLLKRVHA